MPLDTCHKHLIFAHRGANIEAVEQGLFIAENTRAAFNHTLLLPIDGFETDIQLSLDNVPVIWHDWFLDKFGHPGKRIDDFTFQQLNQMDFARAGFSGASPEPPLCLQELIDTYQGRCQINLEIKSFEGESTLRQQRKILETLTVLEPLPRQDVFISSFSLSCLEFAHQQTNDFPLISLLTGQQTQSDLAQLLLTHPYLKGFCLPISKLDCGTVDILRDHGKVLATYTCNTEEELTKALTLEADIIISDYPQLALSSRQHNLLNHP